MENVQNFVVVVNKREVGHVQILHPLMVGKIVRERLKKQDHVTLRNAKVSLIFDVFFFYYRWDVK